MQKFAAAMSMAEKPGLWSANIEIQIRLKSCRQKRVNLWYILNHR